MTKPETTEPAHAWSQTKWYAACTNCGSQNEVDEDDCVSGAESTHTCKSCGMSFAYRAGT